jgi:redox-sensitive bicupin YhaK (pirin superfamily)
MHDRSEAPGMNYYETATATCVIGSGPVDTTIKASVTSHGALPLNRILPAANRAAVGPFLLLDHFGPTALLTDSAIDFPAPSFEGCVALTYLFQDELILDDSVITRTSQALHGIHTWIALPAEISIDDSAREHQATGYTPKLELGEVTIRVILGDIYGQASPIQGYGTALYLVCDIPQSSEFRLPSNYQDVAAYVVSGCMEIDGLTYTEGSMAVAARGWPVRIRAKLPSCVVVIGGMSSTLPLLRTDFLTSADI